MGRQDLDDLGGNGAQAQGPSTMDGCSQSTDEGADTGGIDRGDAPEMKQEPLAASIDLTMRYLVKRLVTPA